MTSMRRCEPVHYLFLKNMSAQFSFSFLSTILLTPREYRSFGISQINLFAGMSSSRQRRTICFSTGLPMILAKLHFRWQNPIKKIFYTKGENRGGKRYVSANVKDFFDHTNQLGYSSGYSSVKGGTY